MAKYSINDIMEGWERVAGANGCVHRECPVCGKHVTLWFKFHDDHGQTEVAFACLECCSAARFRLIAVRTMGSLEGWQTVEMALKSKNQKDPKPQTRTNVWPKTGD